MNFTNENMPKNVYYPSVLKYESSSKIRNKNPLLEKTKSAHVICKIPIPFQQISRYEKATRMLQPAKYHVEKLERRTVVSDEFSVGDKDEPFLGSSPGKCSQSHGCFFGSYKMSNLLNKDYECDCKLSHARKTRKFSKCAHFPMVNVVIPFHEIGELRRIHHEKAVKHIIGRLTYLSVVHLVQWSKSFHYARCNMIVLINSNATSCIQSVVSQNISASAAYRPTHIKPMEVGRDIIPDKIGRCELKCYTITLFNIYSLLFSGTILGVNREHLFTVAPITESRNFFTIMNLYDMLSHSSLQINTMSDSILPLTYDRVNIIIICCELFRSLTTILGVQYPTSIKALSLELNKDHVVKANLKILPRYCCHYLSLFVLSPKTPLQISVVNYHIQSLIYDTESVIIEACKVYCISVDTLDAVCSILIGTSRTLGGVYVVTKAISVSGESCNYLNSYSSFSHKTLGCESVPSCNSSSIQNSNILSFLHDRNNKSASELIVRFTSTMIFWCVESNVSPLCYPPVDLNATVTNSYFREGNWNITEKSIELEDPSSSYRMYSGVCEVNSPFVQESVSTISNSTLKVCPLVTEASVISGFFDYMNTQIYVSFKLNQSNCIGLYSSVHCFLSVCEDCIKVNNEVGVMSHLKHIVSGNFLVKLLISQQVMILSLHTFMSVSYGVSIVENLILNSVIQCKLFTSIITTSQCENLLCRKLLKVKQQRCFWFDWFYHSIMITFSFIGAKISVAGFKSDDQWSLVGIFLALTTCSCIFLYKNHKSR